MPQRRQVLAQPRHDVAAVDLPAVPVVAVRRDEHSGFELGETADGALGAEVRGAARPDRADRGGGEAGDHRVFGVRQIGTDPVAGAHARPAQPAGRRGHRPAQGAEGDLARGPAPLLDAHQRGDVVGPVAQHVLRPVQPRAGEPAGVRHRVGCPHVPPRRREVDLVVVDHGDPEPVQVRDRPGPEGVVISERPPFAHLQPVQVRTERGVVDTGGRRAPERVGHLRRLTGPASTTDVVGRICVCNIDAVHGRRPHADGGVCRVDGALRST